MNYHLEILKCLADIALMKKDRKLKKQIGGLLKCLEENIKCLTSLAHYLNHDKAKSKHKALSKIKSELVFLKGIYNILFFIKMKSYNFKAEKKDKTLKRA